MDLDKGIVKGDYVAASDRSFEGIVKGNIHIAPGVSLRFKGKCKKDVVVEKDASLDLKGIVDGRVLNRGGHVNFKGIIKGGLFDDREDPGGVASIA